MEELTERVRFRLFVMPCCKHQLCWVNPRLPNYCPECGEKSLMALRTDGTHTLIADSNALLTYHEV